MPVLNGLEGVKKKETPCKIFNKVGEVKNILKSGEAATTADSNGAINVWVDDDGYYRCESMAWMRTLDKQIYKKMSDVNKWVSIWLKKII